MVHCPGCRNSFSWGYLNHLQQMHKPQCCAMLAQTQGDLLNSDSDIKANNHDAIPCLDLGLHNEAKGAFLNAILEAHIGNGKSGLGDDIENDGGDLEDRGGTDKDEDKEFIYDDDIYQEWEALISDEPGHQKGMDIDEPDNDEDEDELYQSQEVRWAAEEEFQKTPIMEPFPSMNAGAPIANVCCIPKYESYQKDLTDSKNPWAPFSS